MSDTVIHNERGATTGDHDANAAEALHEPNAVNIPGVVKFLVWLSVAIAVAALLMWGLLRYFDARKAEEAPSPSPLATRPCSWDRLSLEIPGCASHRSIG